jgi:hypothetical protein
MAVIGCPKKGQPGWLDEVFVLKEIGDGGSGSAKAYFLDASAVLP